MRGFARVSVAVPVVRVGDMEANARHTLELFREASAEGASVVVFPELGLSGYTARDLFLDCHLLERCEHALQTILEASESLAPLAVVGMPLRVGDGLYNAAVALQGGKVLGVVPKAYLPNYGEFEEARWFRAGAHVSEGSSAIVRGVSVPFGLDLVFEAEGWPELTVGLEICEDNWVPVPPSSLQVAAGATVIANLSASNFTIGKAELRRALASASPERGKCAYLYVAAGPGESSTDLAFDADAFIYEYGAMLAQSRRFARDGQLVSADVDLELLVRERMRTSSFGDCASAHRRTFRRIGFTAAPPLARLRRRVDPHPFVPSDPSTLGTRCWEIFEIQSNALATRMRALGRPKLVLGVSGGLDSTMAALVAAAALDLEHQPRTDLICATMPGLGTTRGTRDNAERLASALGASFREVPISEASRLVLANVGHPAADGAEDVEALLTRLRGEPALADVAVENVQARLRTLLLMTLANQDGGLVVGTGDLSEKALGWSTYAGDHIAMYDVNAGVPKTLIRFVIRWVANERASTWGEAEAVRAVLFDILDTPISPELLPSDESGEIAQLTEEAIGPYELHDFFLYHLVRHGARPGRILDLAREAFAGRYELQELKRWLATFYRRFFGNQFKRSCTADAPKVGLVALSPRGDWRMPSDAVVREWIDEVDRYKA
jgi:NAD+ synthase (glutamine-hydrolysing)